MEEGVQFFSDLKDSFEPVNDAELMEKLVKVLKDLLFARFSTEDIEKTELEKGNKALEMACPYCGDSLLNPKKKRGHLYYNSKFYVCYNCGKRIGLVPFLDNFGFKNEFSSSEIAYINVNTKPISVSLGEDHRLRTNSASQILGMDDEYGIPRNEIMHKLRLVEITQDTRIFNYLSERKQIFKDNRHFAYSKYHDTLYIFNLSKSRDKVVGIQLRFFKPMKNGGRFFSYNYEDIWKKIFKVEINDDIVQKMNKPSLLYNIFQVNYFQEIFVLESSIDANHIPNSLAVWGANNFVNLPKIGYYLYDNSTQDKAGYKAARATLEKGYNTFLWGSFLRGHGEYMGCNDVNDIVKRKELPIKTYKDYFGHSINDLVYL